MAKEKITIKSAGTLEDAIKFFRFAKKGQKLSSNHPRNEGYYIKQFKTAPDLLLAAYIGHQLIGVILGGLEKKRVLIGEFYIDSKYQKRGFGSQMLYEMEVNVLRHGIRHIYLGADPKAEDFYLKNNYLPELFVQLNTNGSESEVDNLIKQYSDHPIIWRQDDIDGSKVIFQTKGLDKKFESSIARTCPEANIIYLFVKDLRLHQAPSPAPNINYSAFEDPTTT